jgi:hypothetical protein
MAELLNRVRFVTRTTGTGTMTVGPGIAGYATPAEAGAANDTQYSYVIEEGEDFEIGVGTYTTGSATLSRDAVTLSKINGTSGTSKMSLLGSAIVSATARAEDLQGFEDTAEGYANDAAESAAAAALVTGTLPRVNRTSLKALDTAAITVAYLTEAGREGMFLWRTGNYSSQIAADTSEGVYIKANAVASSSGAWVRAYDEAINVQWFGATGDGTTDDRAAIQAAFNVVKARGGRLAFPLPSVRYLITDRIGTDQLTAGDLANNVELWFEPGTTVYFDPASAPAFGNGAIVLEGDNVSITGGLVLNSDKTVTYAADPAPQRTTYYTGIVIGGKGHRRITPALGLEKSGVLVEGVTITNFNAPLVVYGASDVMVRNNTITDDTDTAILIDDCLSNIEVCYNTVRRSFDDCFYARHYYNSPWALAGYYVGDYRIHHNRFTDTYAKSAGFGGIADVNFHNNFCKDTWYGAINIEIGGSTTWYDNSKRIQIYDNIIVNAARNFDPLNVALPAVQQAPPSDTSQRAGVLFKTTLASHPANTFRDVIVRNNTIINPGWHGISGNYSIGVAISGNYMMPGRTVKNATNYDTGGAAIILDECQRVDVVGNTIASDGTYTFTHCYTFNGGTYSQKLKVGQNPMEEFGTALYSLNSSSVETGQFSYLGQNLTATGAWAPGGFTTGTTTTFPLTVTLARLGDVVQVTYSQNLQGLQVSGYVSSSGVVTAAFTNVTGATVSLTAGNVRAIVQRRN